MQAFHSTEKLVVRICQKYILYSFYLNTLTNVLQFLNMGERCGFVHDSNITVIYHNIPPCVLEFRT